MSLIEAVDAMPVTTVVGLERAQTGATLILDGTVSAQNPAIYWDYAVLPVLSWLRSNKA